LTRRDKDLADAVALELDRDAESGPCLGKGFDCDLLALARRIAPRSGT
jgi:hypothetical protein